ncbi:hypothetical protein HLB23_38335 [Nocardia uniformis]|uniref:Class I SAM-dependent methyltransferase n=1 Tax=Nocardia uniformis TaxID=53432 RepID=A0A849CGA1_9NOCA|nr:class I SAM-dependent methyltransferase [Nocardia uniformis]NNH75647.1 hypothetical protein [Nocardia uniformis]
MDEVIIAAADRGADFGPRWWSETESPKAWMSVRDADLYEALLHRIAERRGGREVRVVEWGAGRSTLWYTAFLETLGVPFRWLAIEHDRRFVQEMLSEQVRQRRSAAVVAADTPVAEIVHAVEANATVVVHFDAGTLRPAVPGYEADRLADLDDYVSLPEALGFTADIAVVDGRKRRRCVEAAGRILDEDGVVILHDAWRTYYQPAWREFASHRRFGDEWAIGAHRQTDFSEFLPWHAWQEPPRAETPSSP